MTQPSKSRVLLSWVVHEGKDVLISNLPGVVQGQRPTVTCPECAEALTLRLGSVRVWHAAHRSGASCALTAPESALHHNTKMALAAALRSVREVDVEEPCSGVPGGARSTVCAGSRRRPWVSGWSAVEVERRVETRRPDIVLLDGERVVGAVEVWVSHRVEGDKQALFTTWEMPWAEVKADSVQTDGGPTWSAAAPLPVVAVGPGAPWTCDACVEAARVQGEEQARQQALHNEAKARETEAQRAREAAVATTVQTEKERRTAFSRGVQRMGSEQKQDGMMTERIRVFDSFGGDGVAHRDALVIADTYRGGQKSGAFLGVLGSFEVLSSVSGRVGKEGYLTLKDKAEEFLQWRGRDREVIDSPMEWFNLPSVLADAAFVSAWTEEGHEHRWPSEVVPPPLPWRLHAADERVDCLDLLRFFFVRYLSGLPVRYRWSKKNQNWFQTAVDREEVWRLWPEVPSPRHPG